MKTRYRIRAVYDPINIWGNRHIVVTHCPEGTTLEQAIEFSKSIEAGRGQPYNRRYKLAFTTLIEEEYTQDWSENESL